MEISEIKKQVNIIEVAGKLGIALNRFNKALCPFHGDKNPSLQFSKEKQIATCFSGKCSLGTVDVIGLVEKKLNVNTHEALKYLCGEPPQAISESSIKSAETAGSQTPIEKNKIGEQIKKVSSVELLEKLEFTSSSSFKTSKPAQAYADLRGLSGGGESLLTLNFLGVSFYQAWNNEQREAAEELGLLKKYKENTHSSAFKNRLIFFIRDRSGAPVSVYGRAIDVHNSVPHLYLKGDQKGLYPQYPTVTAKKIILTESIIDAASLLQLQVEGSKLNDYEVLALHGVNGFSNLYLEAIGSLPHLVEIILWLDGDEAGREGVKKISAEIRNSFSHVSISQVITPEGEDINSLLVAHSEAEELFLHLLENRIFLFSFEPGALQSEKLEVKSQKEISESIAIDKLPAVAHGLVQRNPFNVEFKGVAASYSVKGNAWLKQPLEALKVSLQILHLQTQQDYRAKVDLYDYKQSEAMSQLAAERLELSKEAIVKDLQALTYLLEQHREHQQSLSSSKYQQAVPVSANMQSKCLEFLSRENLISRINEQIGKSGVVGEENNRIFLYIIASSYKMKNTLHALIQGSSGSGKTRLLKIVSDLMPTEDVKKYTRVTDSSFYNQEEYFFVNKLVCFEDYDGLKEDAQLAVRELQSNEILISSTSVKEENGKISGGERIVRGPIASMACTTRGEIYEDNISRCFVLAVDESMSQTRRIIEYQNNVAAGIIDKQKEKQVRSFLQDCMRLLKPYEVVNPYANKLQLPQEAHKIRRLNELYQCLVKQITLLNQYRRKQDDKGRLISEKEDLQQACEIMFDSILLKVDELDGSLRQFYEKLKEYVQQKSKSQSGSNDFNRFEVREATGVSKTQQHVYLNRLVQLEYVQQQGFANRGFKYKIAYWDNILAVRSKIKESLQKQLQEL
jgi:DNA primase